MPLVCGGALAFLFAVLAIYVDCYQAIRKSIWCVPNQFWSSKPLLVLAAICGSIAALAFWIASTAIDSPASGWLETLLGSKVPNPYLRGMYTGLAVLTIIRAKLLQIREVDVGPEFFYNEGRLVCLRGIRLSWAGWRDGFVERNLPVAIAKSNLDVQLQDFVTAAISDADPALKASFDNQLAQVLKSKPQSVPSATDISWIVYYQTLIRLALETCGSKPLVNVGLKL